MPAAGKGTKQHNRGRISISEISEIFLLCAPGGMSLLPWLHFLPFSPKQIEKTKHKKRGPKPS
jgi:hypothetical protein